MDPSAMDLSAQKELFATACVRAIAAATGFTYSRPETDDDSVDLTIARRGKGRSLRSPKLDVQIKASSVTALASDGIHYPLKIKNYEDLRASDLMVPRILVVVLLPEAVADWAHQDDKEVALRCRPYWASLEGFPERPNTSTVTVMLPRGQQFTREALTDLMCRV